MPTLHVRGVPEEIYDGLQTMAQRNQRSLSAQVVTMLGQALQAEARRQQQGRLLDSIRRRRFRPEQGTPDSLDLLRADRAR